MIELHWERDLEAAPERVWPHLTYPEKMSGWSEALITRVDDGDQHAPEGVGAIRKVTIRAFGRSTSFEEVIAVSEPPDDETNARFVYHVVRGLPLRDHEGVQTVTKTQSGTHLSWRVRFDPITKALGPPAARSLDQQMNKSLDVLARIVRDDRSQGSLRSRATFHDDDDALPSLGVEAQKILSAQRELASSLRDDPKYWFSRVYQYVTEEQLRFVAEHATHRAWILRLLPVFHRFYVSNLERHVERDRVEAPWRVAFDAMDRARHGDGVAVIKGLLLGVRAHIEEDLPRALAEVWLAHYRGRCDYVRLRADYLRMAHVFRIASARLVDEMPRSWIPPQLRVLVRFAPLEVQDWAFARNYYNVARARRNAFERGLGIASWVMLGKT